MTDRISVTFGVTKNLGNYESARFDTTFETDVPGIGQESLDEAYERAWAVVDKQISEKMDELAQD